MGWLRVVRNGDKWRVEESTPMIRSVQLYLYSIPSVFIDGSIYIGIAFFGAWTAALGTDEAAKYIADVVLFWTRATCTSLGASLLALKMFRSTSYSDHQQAKKAETAFITKP